MSSGTRDSVAAAGCLALEDMLMGVLIRKAVAIVVVDATGTWVVVDIVVVVAAAVEPDGRAVRNQEANQR
jgi:hypothetical protein